jgi:hypothetical protein
VTHIVWYGGTDAAWAENGGVAVKGVHSGAWLDKTKTIPSPQLRLVDGSPAADIVSDGTGHYEFGVDWPDDSDGETVYIDFGAGPYGIEPRGLGSAVTDLKQALAALQVEVDGLSTAPAAPSFNDLVAWAPLTAFTAGTFMRVPDKSLRFVSSDYTSLAAYGTTDTINTRKILDPFYTITEAAAAFAPISQLAELVLYAEGSLDDGFNPNLNGSEQQAGGTVTSMLVELEEPSDGTVTVGAYCFHPGSPSTMICAGTQTIPAGALTASAPLVLGAAGRSISMTTALGSPVVTATGVTAAMSGLPLPAGAGIPTNVFVGTVIPGTSFRLSSDPVLQVDVNATAAGTSTVQIAPTYTYAAHDRWVAYVLQDTQTVYGGSGLKVRLGVGSGSFVVPAAPAAATGFSVATTSTQATLNWTKGVGATEHEVWVNGVPRYRGFNLTSLVYTWAAGETSAKFKILSRVPGAAGPFTSEITATPSAVWKLLPQATPGVWDNTKFATTLGTNSGGGAGQGSPSATVDAASGGHQIAHLRSGSLAGTTTNDPQDRALVKAIVDTTARRGWGFRCLLTPLNSAALLELYFGASGGVPSLSSVGTDWVRATIQPLSMSLEGKAATYDPTGEGNGTTVGSFQRFTDTSYATNILTGASRVAGGNITLPSGMTVGGAYKGLKIIADIPSGGQQRVTVYYGDETQYGTDGSGLPEFFHADLTTRFTSARQAGLFFLQQLGKQTSPTAVEGWDFKDYVDIIPIGV